MNTMLFPVEADKGSLRELLDSSIGIFFFQFSFHIFASFRYKKASLLTLYRSLTENLAKAGKAIQAILDATGKNKGDLHVFQSMLTNISPAGFVQS